MKGKVTIVALAKLVSKGMEGIRERQTYVWTSGTKRLQKMTTLPNDSASITTGTERSVFPTSTSTSTTGSFFQPSLVPLAPRTTTLPNDDDDDDNKSTTCTTPASTEETIRTVTTTQTPVTAATKATIQGASTPAGAVPPTGAGATTPRASATITTTSGVRSTLKARAKKKTKTKLKSLQAESDNDNDNGDRDGDGDEDVDKESDGSIYDDEVEVIPTNNPEVGQWNEENYSNDEFWDSNSYNLEEHEWRGKRKWNTPAACMDAVQRKLLKSNVKTMEKVFSRYSQRPGKGYPANEFVLLQITDINGVGHKGEACRRKKTAVMAYGRNNAVAMYNSWLESTIKGDDNFVNHSATDLKTFTNFWKTEEEDLAGEDAITSSTSATNTENGNAADSPILKVGGSDPTKSKSTPDATPPHQKCGDNYYPQSTHAF